MSDPSPFTVADDGKYMYLMRKHSWSNPIPEVIETAVIGNSVGIPQVPILADGFPGGFFSDSLVQAYLTADERKAAEDERWNSRWWMS